MEGGLELAFISVSVGALLGGAARAGVMRYSLFAEGKGVAIAVAAEVSAILEIARRREFGGARAILARLEDPEHALTIDDILAIRLSQGYLSVYSAVCPKLGLLGPLAGDVIRVYSGLKRLFEDFAELKDLRDRALDGGALPSRAALLKRTREVVDQMTLLSESAVSLTSALSVHAKRRWLGLIP